MCIPNVGDLVECPLCGSEDESIYVELDEVLYIDCCSCGYFEKAYFEELFEENMDETCINSTVKKEKTFDEDDLRIYNYLF